MAAKASKSDSKSCTGCWSCKRLQAKTKLCKCAAASAPSPPKKHLCKLHCCLQATLQHPAPWPLCSSFFCMSNWIFSMGCNLHGFLLLLLDSTLCNCTVACFLPAKLHHCTKSPNLLAYTISATRLPGLLLLPAKLHNCTKRPKLLSYTVSATRPPGLLLLHLRVELLHGLQPARLALTLKLHFLQLHNCLAFCLPNYTTAQNG